MTNIERNTSNRSNGVWQVMEWPRGGQSGAGQPHSLQILVPQNVRNRENHLIIKERLVFIFNELIFFVYLKPRSISTHDTTVHQDQFSLLLMFAQELVK